MSFRFVFLVHPRISKVFLLFGTLELLVQLSTFSTLRSNLSQTSPPRASPSMLSKALTLVSLNRSAYKPQSTLSLALLCPNLQQSVIEIRAFHVALPSWSLFNAGLHANPSIPFHFFDMLADLEKTSRLASSDTVCKTGGFDKRHAPASTCTQALSDFAELLYNSRCMIIHIII